jgi:hypothetical protein
VHIVVQDCCIIIELPKVIHTSPVSSEARPCELRCKTGDRYKECFSRSTRRRAGLQLQEGFSFFESGADLCENPRFSVRVLENGLPLAKNQDLLKQA